jgi:putative sigma-54 modulation protein
MESSDALKDYAKSKIQKIAGHFDSGYSAIVRFRTEKISHIAEFEITISGDKFVGSETATDMYGAIDILEKTIDRQIRRNKEKHLGKNFRTNEK